MNKICKVNRPASQIQTFTPNRKSHFGRRLPSPQTGRGPRSYNKYCHICFKQGHSTQECYYNVKVAGVPGLSPLQETTVRIKQTHPNETFISNVLTSTNFETRQLASRNRDQEMSIVASCSEDSRCPSDFSADYIYHGESDVQNESIYSLPNNLTCVFLSHPNSSELEFTSKGLHFCKLNIQDILPKLDELRILMANDKFADILGLCESGLDPSIMDQQVAIEGLFVKIEWRPGIKPEVVLETH